MSMVDRIQSSTTKVPMTFLLRDAVSTDDFSPFTETFHGQAIKGSILLGTLHDCLTLISIHAICI